MDSNLQKNLVTGFDVNALQGFFIGNRQLGNSVRFLAGNRQPQNKHRRPGGPILGPANLGNLQIRRIRQMNGPMQNYRAKVTRK